MVRLGRRPASAPTHALITGGAGFIGSHLAEALLNQGYRVTIVDNLSTGRLDNISHLAGYPGFRCVINSILNRRSMERLVQSCDIVFHMAAAVGVELILKDPVGTMETNILGSHIILGAAARHGKKVLMASTSEVYGKGVRVPFSEEDDRLVGSTTRSRWSYATAKAVDEFLALAYHRQAGVPAVVFRLFNTVGPRQTGRYGMVIPRLVSQALMGQPLTVYGDGSQSRCFCDVDDAVRAIVGLAEAPEAVGQVFNVGSKTEVSILALARKVLNLAAVTDPAGHPQPSAALSSSGASNGDGNGTADNGRIVFVPYSQAYGPGFEDMQRRVPDTRKIKATIGWEPRLSLDVTLQRVIDSMRGSVAAPAAETQAEAAVAA